MIAVVAEIRAIADQRLDVHGEGMSVARFIYLAQVRVGDGDDATHGRLVALDGAVVLGLDRRPAQIEMRFAVKIRQDFLKTFDGQNVGRQNVVAQKECETRRRADHQRESDVAREGLAGIGQRVIAIELAQRVGGGPLQFQQFAAQREARRHFAQRAFVGGEPGGVQRAHHRENLLAGLDADAGLVGLGTGLADAWRE